MSRCCSESGCKRGKPFMIYRGPMNGRVYLATDYDDTGRVGPSGKIILVAKKRHDITESFNAFMEEEAKRVVQDMRPSLGNPDA